MIAARELRLALAVGVVGGVLFGAREGVATFAANAFADAAHHGVAYLVVPVAVWCLLGPLLMLVVWLAARPFGGASLPAYAATFAALGTLLALVPSLEVGLAQMRATGATPGVAVLGTLVLLPCLLAAAVATMARAGAGWLQQHPLPRYRRAGMATAVIGLAACAWTARFLANNPAAPWASRPTSVWPAPPPGTPNVLVISIDTLRADALGTYGSPHGNTPALDRLAAEGVAFEQAISPAPWTLPALASLMTGLYPRRHGAGGVANRYDPLGRTALAPDVPTLADALASHGYRTQAIVTNPYLLARSGLAAGYQGYENLTFLSEVMLAGRANAGQWLLDHLAPSLAVGDRGVEVSDRAVRWLEEVDDSRPFLLWLHYIDPHGPYGGSGESRHKSFRGESLFGTLTGHESGLDVRSPEPARLRSGEIRLDADGKRAMRALYRAEVAEVDRQVGRVLASLDARRLAGRTIVVIVSDHGEEFWEHGGVEHGHTLYDEVLRVPLLVRWPGRIEAGRRVETVVSLVDIVPTIRDLIGFDGLAGTDGTSLVPVMEGQPAVPRIVLSENLLFAEERVALRSDVAKFVRWANGKEEAYDLKRDPAEHRDLAGSEPFVETLRVQLATLEEGIGPAVIPVTARAIPAAALRALGYVH